MVSIETTDGSTRDAIPATESGARSIVDVDETKFAPAEISPLVASPPSTPPNNPATMARTTKVAVGSERFLLAISSKSSRKIN